MLNEWAAGISPSIKVRASWHWAVQSGVCARSRGFVGLFICLCFTGYTDIVLGSPWKSISVLLILFLLPSVLCPQTMRGFFSFLELWDGSCLSLFLNFGNICRFAVWGVIFTTDAFCLSWMIAFLWMPKTVTFRFNCAVRSEGVPIRSAILENMNW